MWVCTSIPPGITYFPVASMRFAPATLRPLPIMATFSPSTSTSALYVSAAVTTVPLVMSVFPTCLSLDGRYGLRYVSGKEDRAVERQSLPLLPGIGENALVEGRSRGGEIAVEVRSIRGLDLGSRAAKPSVDRGEKNHGCHRLAFRNSHAGQADQCVSDAPLHPKRPERIEALGEQLMRQIDVRAFQMYVRGIHEASTEEEPVAARPPELDRQRVMNQRVILPALGATDLTDERMRPRQQECLPQLCGDIDRLIHVAVHGLGVCLEHPVGAEQENGTDDGCRIARPASRGESGLAQRRRVSVAALLVRQKPGPCEDRGGVTIRGGRRIREDQG